MRSGRSMVSKSGEWLENPIEHWYWWLQNQVTQKENGLVIYYRWATPKCQSNIQHKEKRGPQMRWMDTAMDDFQTMRVAGWGWNVESTFSKLHLVPVLDIKLNNVSKSWLMEYGKNEKHINREIFKNKSTLSNSVSKTFHSRVVLITSIICNDRENPMGCYYKCNGPLRLHSVSQLFPGYNFPRLPMI